MRPRLRKTVAAALSGLLLIQASVAPAAENVWADRHARRAGPAPAPQLASLPLPADGQTQSLLRGLPPLRAALPASAVAADADRPAATVSAGVQGLVDAIPATAGAVQDVYDAGDGAAPPVVLIQDVHLNAEAQANIASLLGALLDRNRIGLVGVEGAFAPFDFTPFRAVAGRPVMKGVADAFLTRGLLAAPSYLGITRDAAPPPFVGIDDRAHYDANVAAYLATRRDKDRTAAGLDAQQRALTADKRRTFSPDLLAFDDLRGAYQSGRLGIGAYLTQLRKFSPDFDGATEQFLAAYDLEKALDFAAVENERRQVLEKLTRALTDAELQDLVARSVAYRLGQVNFAAFYRQLADLCARKGVRLSATPAFDRYVRYVLLSDGIKADALLTGLDAAETRVAARLVTTPEERRLLARSEKLTLARKLTDFALTPSEWERYKANDAPTGDAPLAAFENFYREADTRTAVMLANLTKRPTDKSRVLVMGGFHTPEMAALLRRRKTSFVVVSPRITKLDGVDGSAYLSVFAREKTPLDKLFAGEKLFLAPETVQVTWRATAFRLLASAAARLGNSANVVVRMPGRVLRARVDVDRDDATRDRIQASPGSALPLTDGGRSRARAVAVVSAALLLGAPLLLGAVSPGHVLDAALYLLGLTTVTATALLMAAARTRREMVTPRIDEACGAFCNFLDDVHNINGYFAGDGAAAFAYIGALDEMQRNGKWFNRVGGTSIGALFAVLVATGFDATEIRSLLLNTDFRQFRDRRWRYLPDWVNMLLFGGRYKGEALKNWINAVVGAKLQTTDATGARRDPTLQDLTLPIKVVLTNIDTRQALVVEGGPGTGRDNVGEVIAAAMGYATVFEQRSLRGKRVAQGGMFPGGKLYLPVFDEQIRDEEVVRGFSIVPDGSVRTRAPPTPRQRMARSLLRMILPASGFFARLGATYQDTLSYEQHDPDGKMTVPIAVPAFGLKKLFTLTRDEKEALAARGAEATRTYLADNKLEPTPVVSSQLREALHPGENIDAFFMGGGGKGFVYIGALKALAEQGIRIQDAAGTSVGSAFACLVAAGFTWKEIQTLFIENNLLNLVEDRRWNWAVAPLRWLQKRLPWARRPLHWTEEAVDTAFKVLNLRRRGGLYRSEALINFLSATLKEKLKDKLKPGQEPLMEDLPNLKVVVSDLSADTPEKKVLVINSRDPVHGAVYGKIPVAVAVAASMGLPILFEPPDLGKWVPELKGHILTDGGAVYPGNYLPSVHQNGKTRRVVGFYLNVPKTGEAEPRKMLISLLRKIPLLSVVLDALAVYLIGMGHKSPATTTADTVLPVEVTKGVGLTKFVLTEDEWEEAILSGENSVKRRLQRSGLSQVRATVRYVTVTALRAGEGRAAINTDRYRTVSGESLNPVQQETFGRAEANLQDAIDALSRSDELTPEEQRTLAEMSFVGLWSDTSLLVQEDSTRYAYGTLRISRTRPVVYLPMPYWGAAFDADRKAMAMLALEFSVKWKTRYRELVPRSPAATDDPDELALRSYKVQSEMLRFETGFWAANADRVPASFTALRAALAADDRRTLDTKRAALGRELKQFEDDTAVLQERVLAAFQNPANYREGRNGAGDRVREVDSRRVAAELAAFEADILTAKFFLTDLMRRATAMGAPVSERLIERAKILVAVDSINGWEEDVVRTMRELLPMERYREVEDILRHLANGQMSYRLPSGQATGPALVRYRVQLDAGAMARIRQTMQDEHFNRSLYDYLVERTNAEMDFIDRENRLQAYARVRPLVDRILNDRTPVARAALAPGLVFGATGRPWLDRGVIPLLEELVTTGVPLLTGHLWLAVAFRVAFVLLHAVFGRDGPVASLAALRDRLTSRRFVRDNLTVPFLISVAVSTALVGAFGVDLSSLDAGRIAAAVLGAGAIHGIANTVLSPLVTRRETTAPARADARDAAATWLADLGLGIAQGRIADLLGPADALNVEDLVGPVAREDREAALLARLQSLATDADFRALLTRKLSAGLKGGSRLAPAELAEVLLALVLARAGATPLPPADAKGTRLLLYKGDGNAEVTRVGLMARLLELGLGTRTNLIVDAASRPAAAAALAALKKAGLPVENVTFEADTALPPGEKPADRDVAALIEARHPSHVFVQGFEYVSPLVTILPPIESVQLGNLLAVMRAVMVAA